MMSKSIRWYPAVFIISLPYVYLLFRTFNLCRLNMTRRNQWRPCSSWIQWRHAWNLHQMLCGFVQWFIVIHKHLMTSILWVWGIELSVLHPSNITPISVYNTQVKGLLPTNPGLLPLLLPFMQHCRTYDAVTTFLIKKLEVQYIRLAGKFSQSDMLHNVWP